MRARAVAERSIEERLNDRPLAGHDALDMPDTPPARRPLAAAIAVSLLLFAPTLRAQDEPPPEKPAAPKLVPPKLVEAADPVYPKSKEGSTEEAPKEVMVVLELVLDAEGKVTDAKVATSAGADFDEAALDAAKKLVFEPATRDGKAIPAKIKFRFTFTPPPAPAPAPGPAPAPAPASAPAIVVADEPVELSVQGDKPPREPTKHVIEAEEVKKMPGTNGDALRAIESMPGVARPPGFAGLLIVRGSAPRDTQVFVDGTWIPLAYHFGGITSVIPSEMLSKIDFYPGSFSAEFGRGMGGIVDVGLRSPRKDRLGGVLQLDLLDGRVVAEGPLGARTRFLVAGRRSWVDAWLGPMLRSAGTSVHTAPVYWDWQAMVEHDVSERTTARLTFFGSDDRLALVVDSPAAQDPSFGGAFSGRTTFTRLQLRTDTRISDDTRWINMASWGTNEERFAMGDNRVAVTMAIGNLRSDLRTKIAKGVTAIVGLDAMTVGYDVKIKFPPASEDMVGPLYGRPAREIVAEGHSVRPGAYAMLELSPRPGLKLLPGVRVDYTQENRRLDVDPRFAIRWDVVRGAPRTTLKGAIGVYHQPPLEQAVKPWGDASVRSNTALHASAGFEQALSDGVELSMEGFYKHLRDLIVQRAAETSGETGFRHVNSGSGRVYGAEAMLKWRPGGRFFGWIAYTLSRSERRDAPGEPLKLFQYDQTHILTALGSYDLGRGWSIGARWRYVTGSPYTPYVGGLVDLDAGAYEPVQARPYSSRVAPFHKLDVRVDKTWRFTDWRLTAYLDVQNVYNRANPEGQVYSYDFAQAKPAPGLPILPIVGLRGEL